MLGGHNQLSAIGNTDEKLSRRKNAENFKTKCSQTCPMSKFVSKNIFIIDYKLLHCI